MSRQKIFRRIGSLFPNRPQEGTRSCRITKPMRKTTFEHYRSKVGAIMKTTLVSCLLVMFIVGTFHPAEAQTLPTDPIQTTCIVPSAPGAGHPVTPPEGFTSLCQPPDSIWDISHNDVPASPPTDPMGNGDAPAPPPSDTTGPPHWLGVQTPANVRGILGTFQVRDTPVQHIPPTDDFVNQHLLVKSCDGEIVKSCGTELDHAASSSSS